MVIIGSWNVNITSLYFKRYNTKFLMGKDSYIDV